MIEIDFKNYTIGVGLTGSYCTLDTVYPVLEELKNRGAELHIVFSENVYQTDTRFGPARKWIKLFSGLTEHPIMSMIPEAEPIGPQKMFDLFLIAPCTGNTLAKLARAVTDTAVLMAAKAHLRNGRPLVIAVSTNDALGANAMNLGLLLNRRCIYFVPFGQDDPEGKENSLVSRMGLIPKTIQLALDGRQIQPVLVEYTQ